MSDDLRISRRLAIQLSLGVGLGATIAPSLLAQSAQRAALLTRKVPSSGELLPVIGLGTARGFDRAADRQSVNDIVGQFAGYGGKVIDTSPAYGDAEMLIGEAARGS